MSAQQLLEQNLAYMSNYSIYFLRQNSGLDINCSVYSLTSGSIQYQEYTSGTWSANMTSLLPAFYVANCSVPELWAHISKQNVSAADIEVWLEEYRRNPYNEADNGDSFVALLFMLAGSCVSSWMLSFLFLLSPKPKRKPILTQVAMLFYSIHLTVVFSKVSATTRAEYYADSLDMVRILSEMNGVRYFVVYLVSNLLKQLACLELILTITKHRWRRANAAFVSLLIIASLISGAFLVPLMRDRFQFVTVPASKTGTVFTAFRVIYMVWLAVCLAHYTFFGTATPPKQVAYSRKLLPLALLTWFFIAAFIVVTLLLITLWNDDWLTNAWMSFLPNILGMYVLTACWEWIYSIRHLESRLEIVDMLGRRISLEDVMDFSTDDKVRRTALRGRFASLRDVFSKNRGNLKKGKAVFSVTPSSSTYTPAVVDCSDDNSVVANRGPSALGSNTNQGDQSDAESSAYEVHYIDTDSWEQRSNRMDLLAGDRQGDAESASGFVNDHESSSNGNGAGSTGVFHFDGPVEGTSAQTEANNGDSDNDDEGDIDDNALPPFRPLPGFSKEDYWDDK